MFIRSTKLIATVVLAIGGIFNTHSPNSTPNTSVVGLNAVDAFTYNGKTVSNYSLGWYNDPDNTPPMAYLSGFYGVKFFTWAKPRLFIEGESGRIGINTVSPQALLHVNALPIASQTTIRIGGADPGNINVPYGAATGSYNIDFHTWRDVLPHQLGASIQAQRINVFENNNALVQGMDLAFLTSDGWDQAHLAERLRIRYDGKIGIGTRNPDAMLTVKGGIHAEEVKVDLSIPVPDYVFHKNYKLMTLGQIGEYVDTYHHLPEIPSAKEIAKDGISLGKMDMKLLKKVEELTLYLLEKDKQLIKQQQQLNQQARRILALEQRGIRKQ